MTVIYIDEAIKQEEPPEKLLPKWRFKKKPGAGKRPEPKPPNEYSYDGSFTRVENAVARQCPGISPAALGIYTFLASFIADGQSYSWPSVEKTIATYFQISHATAEKYIAELVAWGHLEIKKRRNKKTGKKLNHIYFFKHRPFMLTGEKPSPKFGGSPSPKFGE